ncbi:MAG: M23 family metallopeptidase [Spirochaetes bacterium]|nr:M23 family metallopeptidase [Spirochaetota bacterium]
MIRRRKMDKDYKINFIILYLVSALTLFLMLFAIFSLGFFEDNNILIKQRNLKSVKSLYDKNNSSEEGVGGAYTPDTISAPLSHLDYYVKVGDSIHSIAGKFGIDEVTIIKFNNITIPSKIVLGTKVMIPNQDGIIENVTKNNNLEKISNKYSVEKEEILRVNNCDASSDVSTVFIPGIHHDNISKQLLLGEYFRRPCYGRFTSYFGYRKDPWTKLRSYHSGVDIANSPGSYIYAAAPGKVIFVGSYWPLGNAIKIQHTSGYVSYYGHMSKFLVKNGTWVEAGRIIGLMGSTGRSTGSHLHFEVRRYGAIINPMRVTVF